MISQDTPSHADELPPYPEALMGEGLSLWALALGVVVALHLGAATWLLLPSREAQIGNPDDDAVAVDLVPVSADPTTIPDDDVGAPVEQQAAPTSERVQADDPAPPAAEAPTPAQVEHKPDMPPPVPAVPPQPGPSDAVLQPSPPVDPELKAEQPKPDLAETKPTARPDDAPRHSAPSRASEGSAALLGGGHRPSAAAQATWRGAVAAHLVQKRRYPQEARDRRMQGTATVRVTVDATGHVTDCTLVKSSGHALLDGEALALMRRADPFPTPPRGLPTPISLTVPVSFAIR